MQIVRTIEAIEELAQNVTLYVRYTSDIEADIRRGYSLNHQTGHREAGLSVNPVDTTSRSRLVATLVEYEHLRLGTGAAGVLVTGVEVGTGSDGEPLLRDLEPIAVLGEELQMAGGLEPLEYEAREKLEDALERVERLTDAFARRIYREAAEVASLGLEHLEAGRRDRAQRLLRQPRSKWHSADRAEIKRRMQ